MPEHHFAGVSSLKAAIVARGYRMFTAEMQAARARAATSPRACLVAICEGYLGLAKTHNALFQLMFYAPAKVKSHIQSQIKEELRRESAAAYSELQAACAPFEPVSAQSQSTEVMVWSLVHGYAMLFDGEAGAGTPARPAPDFEQLLPDFPLR
ncbi:MAG: WHG domain-containing protein [Rhodobacteraceae bacterium]|nr:WHG domain-containing protein [Paracoccaceae bacterium]